MTTNSQHNEIRPLSEAELDAVYGGTTIGMMSSSVVLQQELTAAYASTHPTPYNWHNW